MLHTKQASNLLQDLFPTLADSITHNIIGNKSCSRFEACFARNMNYYCDHDICSSKSHVSS